jgi:hypothetical protein
MVCILKYTLNKTFDTPKIASLFDLPLVIGLLSLAATVNPIKL